jgi:group I intron endonuclease
MPRKQKEYNYIYKTTNLVNGKYYIGMHSTDNLNDEYIGSGKQLWYSIKKYGKENFKCEILEFLSDRNSLKKREKELVNENILKDEMCLNLKIGGEGGLVNEEHSYKFHSAGGRAVRKIFSERHRERLKNDSDYYSSFCEKLKGKQTWWEGKKHSEETKQKMKKSKNVGENNSQHGTIWITNDIENRKIKKNNTIPDKWKIGRTLKKKI